MDEQQSTAKKPTNWVWRALTWPDEWCDCCLHNSGAYIRPFKLSPEGVTQYPVMFRCFTCGDWREATDEEIERNGG